MFPSPSITPPTLENYQWKFNGLTLGANTPFGVLKAEGLDFAIPRTGDAPWPRDHGEARGLDIWGGRDVILDLWVKSDGTSLQHALLALAAAQNIKPTAESPLWFQLPNLPIMCVMCRPRKRPYPIDSDYSAANIAKPELSLHATDPRIYSAGKEASVALGAIPETGGLIAAKNEGNTEARFVVIFQGEVAGPALQNLSIAGTPTIRFTPPGEEPVEKMTVPADYQLSVNTGIPHLVQLYKGTVAEGDWENAMKLLTWDSIWFDLIPGENSLRYHADSLSPEASTATVQWASAWQL